MNEAGTFFSRLAIQSQRDSRMTRSTIRAKVICVLCPGRTAISSALCATRRRWITIGNVLQSREKNALGFDKSENIAADLMISFVIQSRGHCQIQPREGKAAALRGCQPLELAPSFSSKAVLKACCCSIIRLQSHWLTLSYCILPG